MMFRCFSGERARLQKEFEEERARLLKELDDAKLSGKLLLDEAQRIADEQKIGVEKAIMVESSKKSQQISTLQIQYDELLSEVQRLTIELKEERPKNFQLKLEIDRLNNELKETQPSK